MPSFYQKKILMMPLVKSQVFWQISMLKIVAPCGRFDLWPCFGVEHAVCISVLSLSSLSVLPKLCRRCSAPGCSLPRWRWAQCFLLWCGLQAPRIKSLWLGTLSTLEFWGLGRSKSCCPPMSSRNDWKATCFLLLGTVGSSDLTIFVWKQISKSSFARSTLVLREPSWESVHRVIWQNLMCSQ